MINEIKSIIEGLTIQTTSDTIKWINDIEMKKMNKDSFLYDTHDLSPNLYYKLDSGTSFKVPFTLQHDHSISNSYLIINNEKLQRGWIVTGYKDFPKEYAELEKILYEKYIISLLKNSDKNIVTDTKILNNIVSKCGIEAVRNAKLNDILDDNKKGFFKKIFS